MSQPLDRMTEYHGALIKAAWVRAFDELTAQIADTHAIVLLRGERGVGKDRMARVIHAASTRHDHPFVKMDCSTTPPDGLESALFGHEKGAFPEAHRRKLGRVEFAHKGTVFLDEIGGFPPALQPKVLRLLRERECVRIGSRDAIQVDVQVIAGTTESLTGTPRRDGPWESSDCLKVVDIHIPPLRERRDEIPALAALFLARFNRHYGRSAELSAEMLAMFAEYAWPGNVRELETVVRRVAVTGDVSRIHEEIRSQLRHAALAGKTSRSA